MQHQAIAREKIRLEVLGWQYRSALKLHPNKADNVGGKESKEEYKGLSKKERKKLKKKHKKIEKTQKKKQDERIILELVHFDVKRVKLFNVPGKTVRKSVWASYLFDYNRPRSLSPKRSHLEDVPKHRKSVRGSLNSTSYS
jgi:hypothetical protein